MTLAFVQATKEDVLGINPQGPQGDPAILEIGRGVFERDLVPLDGRAIAIRDCGRCVGAYGLVETSPGIAWAWALFSSDLLADHPVLLGLHVARDLRKADGFGFHRIEATTGVDHATGADFLRWLGFKRDNSVAAPECPTERHTYARIHDEL